ncbi:hypothetical protein RF11_01747 [Thelohanellus kitauei]|uniref:CCHC-type domain-containing protein n=1 Tax=Thelohanellus kitauei TaxID=669202 RepID=A0A0C2M1T9_THEKT|nr:hypothetical protein RF11_01747 [Thelohanellus kitauei]
MATKVKKEDLYTTNGQVRFERFDENVEDWTYYEKRFELTLKIEGISDGGPLEEQRRDLLLKCIGPDHFRAILDNFNDRDYESLSYQEIRGFLRQKFDKKINYLYQRYMFNKTTQNSDEKIAMFLSRLKSVSNKCQFGSSLEERLRDQFILGLGAEDIQKELFYKFSSVDVSLNEVFEVARSLEEAKENIQTMHGVSTFGNVNAVKNKGHNEKNFASREEQNQKVIDPRITCIRCGKARHSQVALCPALKEECRYCKKIGHFARVCLKAGNRVEDKKQFKSVKRIDSDDSYFFINSFQTVKNRFIENNIRGWKINVELNGLPVKMMIDSAASVSCIGYSLWKQLKKPKLRPMGDLKGYTDNPIKTLGKTQVQVNLPGKQENLPVVVTIKDDEPILGLDWMLKLGIGIQINHLTLDNDRKCSDSELSNTLKEYDTIFVENNKGVKNYKAKISFWKFLFTY